MQRACGTGRFSVGRDARLETLYQSGSAKIRFSRSSDGVRDAVLINTAGGLAGGDRLDWEATLGPHGQCRIVSQACEKVYRSVEGPALVTVALSIGAGAALEWLPQETILFDQSKLDRRFDIEVSPSGRLLAVEAVIAGRRAMGETDIRAQLRDRWRVRRNGRLIFADNLTLEDLPAITRRRGLLNSAGAFASVLMVASDAEALATPVRDALNEMSGVSAFDGKLFCRILAQDGLELRRILLPVLAALRQGSALPRLWTV